MLVDSHAHLDSPELSDALDEIIDRAREASPVRQRRVYGMLVLGRTSSPECAACGA